jgi:hypothetical protein
LTCDLDGTTLSPILTGSEISMSRSAFFVILTMSTIILAGCAKGDVAAARQAEQPVRAASGPSPEQVRGLSAREAMALANEWFAAKNGVKTNVDARYVNFEFPGGKTERVALPEDQMVVAIAPYVERTHPCEIHFMSGCQGEIVQKELKLNVKRSDGSVLINDRIETMANGFVELWLPREQQFQVTFEYQGRRASGTISTYDDSNTCITTLQLM